MNWTKTPPTKPGAYWWKAQTGAIKCCEVFTDRDGNLIAQGFGVSDDVELLRGEWCGPLVPAEDLAKAQAQCAELRSQVERAWKECQQYNTPPSDVQKYRWENSRARKVANGKAVS